jgi:uncharacterized lipoprotein YddW (UPF0748 family)
MTILDMMAHLEDLYARRELAAMEHEQARNAILTPEQRTRLVRIDSDYDSLMEEIADAIKAAEEQVKAAVAEAGETVKGQRYQAVYGKPRASWDKGLEDYLRGKDPEALKRYRKEGAPSVSIRLVKA